MCRPDDHVHPLIRRAADDARQAVQNALARLTAKLDAANKEDNERSPHEPSGPPLAGAARR